MLSAPSILKITLSSIADENFAMLRTTMHCMALLMRLLRGCARVNKFSALTPKMHALIALQRKFMLSPGDVQCGQNNIANVSALYFALCPLRYKLLSRWPNGHCYPSAKVFKVVHRCVVLAAYGHNKLMGVTNVRDSKLNSA